ncbi:MAG: carbohydrate ABC transporter permease [Anaerolineales bacterium]|nr:carbohydrate ABC transporter permease [Anaerolineales bacterium]MCB9004616.1 carbohydrate ABC transporter permease [Ardenticatenaceae bacterium]
MTTATSSLRSSLTWQKRIGKFIGYVALLLLGFFFLFPTVVMIVLSLQPDETAITQDMGSIWMFIPRAVSLQNYVDVFERIDFPLAFFNSLLIVGLTIIFGLFVNSLIAYSLARMQWKGRNWVLAIVVALMIIPFEAIAVPLLKVVNVFGWLNSYHVQIIPFIADAFSIFLFYQFFIGLPKDLEEAALVDGASRFRMYWQIVVPLSLPVFATVAILQFIFKWGMLLWPLMVTRGPEFMPLPLAMNTLYGQAPFLWGDRFAFAALMTLPTLAVFLIFQKWFVQSVASSGVKG